MIEIASVLTNSGIENLDVRHNPGVGSKGIAALCRAVIGSKMRVLTLGDEVQLDDEAMQAMSEMLAHSDVEELVLRGVRMSNRGAELFAEHLVSQLDDDQGTAIRERALDAKSLGVALQAEQRKAASEEGYTEPNLWTGVGRARSGCGAALVGSVDQVLSKIERYKKMGMRAFIFSGYPHKDECEIFGEKVLPHLETCSLPEAYGRVPASTPATPLGIGERK